MSDEAWTLERVAREHSDLEPLARLHLVLADESARFATSGEGPPARPAFRGPPAVHWMAGRCLVDAAEPEVMESLLAPLTRRLAARLGAEFEDVADASAELGAALADPEFPWREHLARFREPASHDAVAAPHPALFRFLFLRALAAVATHFATSFSPPHAERWQRAACPYCGMPPAASVARSGSVRELLCVLCGGRWTTESLKCVACGEQRPDRLRVLASRDAGPASLEACDTCHTGLKVFSDVHLTPGPPLALEVLTLRLDIVAERDENVRREEPALAALYPPD